MLKKCIIVGIVSYVLCAGVFWLGFNAGNLNADRNRTETAVSDAAAAQPTASPTETVNEPAEQSLPEPDAIAEEEFQGFADGEDLDAFTFDALPISTPDASQSFSSIIKGASDSVVSINVTGTASNFFGRTFETGSAGSGIIFSEDGENIYIVTNFHVIERANSVTISVDDAIQAPASFVGGDSVSDIAVISVSKTEMAKAGIKNYKLAVFGDSTQIEIGDLAIAIGNALGEGKSATLGIISALNKTINIDNKELNVIQTDAAINPGNSGGALINAKSQVIGINTAKLSSYGVEGMGYSIPINDAKVIIENLMKNKDHPIPEPGYLGISGLTVTEQIKDTNSLPSEGVYVRTAYPGAGAFAAGIRNNDLIVGINDVSVKTFEALSEELAKYKAGEKINVSYYEGCKILKTVEVTLTGAGTNTNF